MIVIANPTAGRVKQSLRMLTSRRIPGVVITKHGHSQGLLCRSERLEVNRYHLITIAARSDGTGRVKQSLRMPTSRRIPGVVITKHGHFQGLLCRKDDPSPMDDSRGCQ